MKRFFALLLSALMLLSVCSVALADAIDFSALTMDELIAKAKEDGHIESVGMPDDWADWGDSWKAITEKYGIEHYDSDMSSTEELSIMRTEGENGTKDIGDVGHAFTSTAIEQDLLQGYKPTTWDSIPDWAKDPEGRWIISYTGTMCFCINTTLSEGKVPTTWKELMDSGLTVSPGNVVGGASSQAAVICAAIAMGGGMDNVQPGIDYFVKLAEEGRLDPGECNRNRIANGECVVSVGLYDYSGLGHRDFVNASDSGYKLEVVIPQDGAITSGYGLVFNKYAPHPYATALAIEYLLSDEGQIDRARGYARPIRNVELPEELKSIMLPDEMYQNNTPVDDVVLFTEACQQVSELWEEEVLPLLY